MHGQRGAAHGSHCLEGWDGVRVKRFFERVSHLIFLPVQPPSFQ